MATVSELCQGCEQRPPVLVMFVAGGSGSGDAALCRMCFEAAQRELAGKPGVSVRTVAMEQFVGALRQLPDGMADWVIQAYAGPAEGIGGPCEVCRGRDALVFAVVRGGGRTAKARMCRPCFQTCGPVMAERFGGTVESVSLQEFEATLEGLVGAEGV